MAPFLTHLVIGERVWHSVGDGASPAPRRPWTGSGCYGAFLFGCLAPDVDKFCPGLEQATTHFLPKDQGYAYAWQRSRQFLDHRADVLRAPFRALTATEQAWVLGYLCHVATDEITARRAKALEAQFEGRGARLPSVDAVLTAMDPRLWARAADPEGMTQALAAAAIPVGTLVFAPASCLCAMHRVVLPQVREGGGLDPFLRMVRRHQNWLRHGRVSDAAADAALEADLAGLRRRIEADLPASEQLVGQMDWDRFLEEAVAHSQERITWLQALEGMG